MAVAEVEDGAGTPAGPTAGSGATPSTAPAAPPAVPPTAAATTAEHPWPVRLLSAKISEYVAKMSTIWVEGQVVQCTLRPGTGVAFITLRDTDVDMSLPVTARRNLLTSVFPDGVREGARVVVRATPEFWTKRGSLQLSAVEIRAVGVGELLARIEHLKRVLAAEGLLEPSRKKPLPFLPRAVGLVCGRGSAAERDVVVTATARWPSVRFVVRTVPVQGPSAAREVTAALRELDEDPEVDVVVLARGGGSLEDLLAFSDEGLVRAVAAARTPVVSAIGHEVDSPCATWWPTCAPPPPPTRGAAWCQRWPRSWPGSPGPASAPWSRCAGAWPRSSPVWTRCARARRWPSRRGWWTCAPTRSACWSGGPGAGWTRC